MKNSLLILGIALVSFTNVCNAKIITNESISLFQLEVFSYNKEGISSENGIIAKPSLNEETEAFNPETVIVYKGKTMKETIAEGDKIIENTTPNDFELVVYEESMKEVIAQAELIIENSVSNVTYSLFNERTVEDEITTLEMIIESKETNETKSLDLKKINSNPVMAKTFNYKEIVGMD